MSTTDFITVALSAEPPRRDRRQWVHYLPTGQFNARDGRGPWLLDDPQAFADASFSHSGGSPIPVDYDHALLAAASEARTPAPAAGWISELASRRDGIWGLTEWTPKAADHIAAKEYRFVSPLFFHTKEGVATALKAAALTNQPALTSLMAVCSLEPSKMDLEQLCTQLRPLLGLTDAAAPDAILEAARRLSTKLTAASAAPAPDKFVPIAEFERVVSALNTQSRGVSAEAAEIAVADAIERGRLMPSLKEWGLSICSQNKPAFDAFLARTSGGMQALLSRPLEGRSPAGSGRSVSDVEREIALKMGHSPDELV